MSEPTVASLQKQADLTVVKVDVTRLDETTTRHLQALISDEGARSPKTPFVIDFSKVGFLSSLSLAAIVRVAKEFDHRSQRLIIASLQPAVRDVFEVTRLTRLLEVQNDAKAAMEAIRNHLPRQFGLDDDEDSSSSQ